MNPASCLEELKVRDDRVAEAIAAFAALIGRLGRMVDGSAGLSQAEREELRSLCREASSQIARLGRVFDYERVLERKLLRALAAPPPQRDHC